MLADEHRKRVIVVDTSNEIGGDGDVPHVGIGRARRMQVPNVHMQHNVSLRPLEKMNPLPLSPSFHSVKHLTAGCEIFFLMVFC